jgi:hypothetical protein
MKPIAMLAEWIGRLCRLSWRATSGLRRAFVFAAFAGAGELIAVFGAEAAKLELDPLVKQLVAIGVAATLAGLDKAKRTHVPA